MTNELKALFPLSVSDSSLSLAKSCKRKWFYAKILHLEEEQEESVHLKAGKLFALAMEGLRKDVYLKGVPEDEALEKQKKMILEAPHTGDFIKSNERLAMELDLYVKTMPLVESFRPCKLEDGSLAVEYYFEMDTGIPHPDFPDRNILYTGFLDGLYEQLDEKGEVSGIYIVDEKTTGSVYRIKGTKNVDVEKETNLFRLSGQFIGYAAAAKAQGISVKGVLVRRLPILKNHEDAFELEIPITSHAITSWEKGIISLIRGLVEDYKSYKEGKCKEETYPSVYNNSCNFYGVLCKYSEACLTKIGERIVLFDAKQSVLTVTPEGERVTVDLDEYITQIKGEDK